MTDAQTEARAIAQTSLWVPAKPEHAKLGWTYDFEQTERISRAAYDSTGYEATMEVVEFVMAEADRRHATALAAKDAELVALRWRNDELEPIVQKLVSANIREKVLQDKLERAEAQLAEARKALEPFAALADIFDHHGGNRPREGVIAQWSDHRVGDREITVEHLRAARRAREQGGSNA